MSKITGRIIKYQRNPLNCGIFKRFVSSKKPPAPKKPPSKCLIGNQFEFKVVLVRHGESEWNAKNMFCGWYDSFLSPKGQSEARRAGDAIREAGFMFDIAYTSMLTRAQQTLQMILMQNDRPTIRSQESWRLNERHYGALTGLNKSDTAKKFGEDKVALWRRSYDVPPPPMGKDHPFHDDIVYDVRYDAGPSPEDFPKSESLKMTIERTLPFWYKTIVPSIRAGKKVLIVAHGNSLRGIVKHVEDLSDSQIMDVNIPTATPFVYTLNRNMDPKKPREYLGDAKAIKKAMEKVKNQGKKKKK